MFVILQLYGLNKEKLNGLKQYKDYCIESELSTGDKVLSFLYPIELAKDIVEEGYIRNKTDEFVIKEISKQGQWKSVKAKLNVEDLEGKVFESFETVNKSIVDCINLALAGTGWIVGTCDVTKRRTVRKTNSSSWDIIQEAKSTYNCELEFDTLNKRINIYEKRGSDKGVCFLDSLNLKDLSIQGDSYDFYTRIIAKGKDDLKVTLENFQYSSKVKTYIWKDERYTDIESLTEDAEAKLDELSKPYRAYSATVIDLANISKENYKDILSYGLGDVITLVSKENGLKEKQRIVKMVKYPDEPTRNTCEIANTTLSFEDVQKEFQDTTDTVNNITTDNGTIDGSTIDGISTEQIYDFETNVAKITDLTAVKADIEELYAEKANIGELNAVVANVAELNVTKANITDLNATNINVENLIASNTKINEALINKADITELKATNANIETLTAKVGEINTLVSGNISSENIQTGGITGSNLNMETIFVNDANIINVNASKINTGSINTNEVTIQSENGGIIIADNTQQFKDKNGKVRVQIGQDAKGDFNFGVFDSTGSGVLIDATGVKEKALADGIIKDRMIGTGEINGSKIDINSLITEVNKDTNTNSIKGSKVLLDTQGQKLDIAFNSLKSQADATKTQTESNTTQLGIEQGKINTLIQDTTIVKDGQSLKLKDEYSKLEQTVSGIKTTVGQQTTTITEVGQKADSANSKIDDLQVGSRNLWIKNKTTGYSAIEKLGDNHVTGQTECYRINNNATLTFNIEPDYSTRLYRKVTFSAWVKYENVVQGTNAWNVFNCFKHALSRKNSSTGATTSTDYTTLKGFTGTSGWKKIEVTYDYSSNTSYDMLKTTLRFNVEGAKSGTAWVTGIKVEFGNKATDWTPAPEDIDSAIGEVVNDVSTLTGKVTTVENKYTTLSQDLSGFKTTVGNTYSTKSELSSVDGKVTSLTSRVGTTESNITQLNNKIALKVEATDITTAINNVKVGGDNVLRNGNFANGTSNWSTHDMNSGGTSKAIIVKNGDGVWSPSNKKVLIIQGTNTVDRYGVRSSTIKLIPNTKYTVSGYCAGHRVSKIQVNVRDVNNSDANIFTQNLTPVTGGATLDKWYRFELTFTTTSNTDFVLNLYSVNMADNGYVWFSDVQIQIGTKATAWTPCAEDIDSAITSVDSKVTTTSNKVATIETNLNSITQRVSSTESTVSTHTTQLGTVDSRINTAKTSAISTAASDATSKANAAQTNATNAAKSYTDGQISTVNKTITDKVAEIKTTTDSITSRVSKAETTLTSTTTTANNALSTANTANSNINNLQIGGRNLSQGTSNTYSNAYTNFSGGTNTCPSLGKVLTDGLVVGDTVTVKLIYKYTNIVAASGQTAACWIQGSGNSTAWNSGAFAGSAKKTLSGSGEHTFLYSFKVTADHLKNSYWDTNIRHDYVQSGSVQWKLYKVEKGTKPTDWTPAPEDINNSISSLTSRITTAEQKITADAIVSTVTSSTKYTTDLNSKANQSALNTTNNNVSTLTTRMSSAEQKITSTAILNSVNTQIGAGGQINTTSTILDKTGFTVKNGALKVQNNAGTTVLEGDSSGNLTMKNGCFKVLSSSNSEIASINQNNWMRLQGLELFGAGECMQNKGSGVRSMKLISTDGKASHIDFNENSSVEYTVRLIREANSKSLTVLGNGMTLLPYTANTACGLEMRSQANWAFIDFTSNSTDDYHARLYLKNNDKNIYTAGTGLIVQGNLNVTGSKNCLQATKNYGERLINAYETAEYYFGDLGFGKINSDGECLINIDDIFQECINTDVEYHVFTQVYNGSIKTIERYKTYFIVKGDPETNFSWEIKAKRIGHENNRLDLLDIDNFTVDGIKTFKDEDLLVETAEDTLLDILTFDLEKILMEE